MVPGAGAAGSMTVMVGRRSTCGRHADAERG
jgi:hypothetical protein